MCYVSSRCSRSYAYEDGCFYVFDEAVITSYNRLVQHMCCCYLLFISYCESPKRFFLTC